MSRTRKLASKLRSGREDASQLLIRTKLAPPAASDPSVSREELLAPLRRDARWRVLLVHAPAGYGKSEFLRQLYAEDDLAVVHRAWLELDYEDDDPRRLLRYLAAALARAGLLSARAREWAPLLTGEVERARHFDQLTALLAAQREPLLLVFDACERMREPAAWELLAQMAHYLPKVVRLVFASRNEIPISFARERVTPEFVGYGVAALRASTAEAESLLAGLELERDESELLRRRCQGWWHGLRLGARAALNVDAEERTQELERFSGTHPVLVEYFRRDACPADAATKRLLEVASVPERINQGLFDRLLGKGAKAITLEKLLEQAPFFLAAEEHGWHQPHPLYAEFMRAELAIRDAEGLQRMHVETAHWLSGHGYVEGGVRHALHVGDDALALGFINRCYDELVEQGQLETLSLWRSLLPEQFVSRYPLVALLWGWELLVHGKEGEAVSLAQRVRDVLTGSALDPDGEQFAEEVARVDTLLAVVQLKCGDVEAVPDRQPAGPVRTGLQALAQAQRAAWCGEQEVELAALGMAAERQVQTASPFLAVLGDTLRARLFLHTGDLESALGLARLCERRLESDQERRLLGRLSWLVQMEVLWERNEGRDQLAAMRSALEAPHPLRPALQAVQGWCLLADMMASAGEHAQARTALRQVRGRISSEPLVRLLYAAEIRVALASGEQRDVGELARVSGIDHCRDDEAWSPAWHESLAVAARVALARGAPDTALRLIHRLQASVPTWRALDLARLLALECVALHADGQSDAALEGLLRLVKQGARVHLVRSFLSAGDGMESLLRTLHTGERLSSAPLGMYVNRLLEAFAQESPAKPASANDGAVAEPVEKLTDRESEVLEMVADGHSNQEISEKLFLSIGTIKWHLHNIYDKLMVRNRTQAVKRARELNWMR